MFFGMILYCASQTESCTLEQACSMVDEKFGVKISKQSLNERFNKDAIVYVKQILSLALERQLSEVLIPGFLPQFKKIRIKDGTRFNLPDRLSEYYKGSGGSKGVSNAAVCIQYEYDARSGKILSLDITSGTKNDQIDAKETVNRVDLDDLIIRDLGYYSLPTLTSFDLAGAFFITRLGTKTNIYKPEEQKEVSFKSLYEDMLKKQQTCIEMDIHAGKKERMPLRLIVSIIPEEVYQKRIRDAEKNNKSRGHNTSDDFKSRCRFNLFITKVKSEVLSAEEIIVLYKLRWQIELVFKIWKTTCKIDEIKPMKYERFTCILYAKLILIVLNQQLIWNLKRYYYLKVGKILSLFKCFTTLQSKFEKIYGIMKNKRKESEKNLQEIVKIFSSNHWKEKRKNRLNYEDIIDLFICKSII